MPRVYSSLRAILGAGGYPKKGKKKKEIRIMLCALTGAVGRDKTT
uniref:Uncharacterized protein n=1 Tax=uncultured bacterium contig00021 TaxID=1181511 RepID=A0A806K290_9BACT|nr:hypothetical protein [uncultured bacterium contig00021]